METSRSLIKIFELLFPRLIHKVRLPKSTENYTEKILFPSVDLDILFLRGVNRSTLFRKKIFLKFNGVKANNFSTSTNSRFWNKLIPFEHCAQVPTKLFAHKAEVEQLAVEGVGWAGQPIVKRVHSVLPEVYSDISDVFYSVKLSTQDHKDCKLSTLSETLKDNTTQSGDHLDKFKTADWVGEESFVNASERNQNTLESGKGSLMMPEEVKSRIRSHDTIPFINENVKQKINDSVWSGENGTENKVGKKARNETQRLGLFKIGVVKSDIKKAKRGDVDFKSGIVFQNSKKKIRKKTKVKVCNSKNPSVLNMGKVKKTKKKKKTKVFGINKKTKLQPQLVLSQRINTQPFQQKVLLMENRQLKTDSTSRLPKRSGKTKEKQVSKMNKEATGKNKKKGFKKVKKESFADDCVCPESSETKRERKGAKICGEATAIEKKLNEWKPKMCSIEKKVRKQRRTFVCASKIKNNKRKRKLPKCVKPEKMKPPKALICPPNLVDDLKKESKICEKQEEEVKIRKRTRVCKPVIIYGREEAGIKVEKAVCVKTVKKISRHVKICEPPNVKNAKKKSKKY